MTDTDLLTELLERAGSHTLGPPPIEDMLAAARRKGRRRIMVLTATTIAAVGAVVAATAVLPTPGSDREGDPAPATSASPSSPTASDSTPITDLQGTWIVRGLVDADGESVLVASPKGKVRLTFADGKVTGTTGCNDISGTYKQRGEDGTDLRFPRKQLGSTLAACANEPPLLSRLLDVRHVSGIPRVRYLHAEDGMIIAELRR